MNYPKRYGLVAPVLLAVGLFVCGCSTLQQLAQIATLTKCEFRLASVEGTSLAGVPIQGITQPSDIGLMDMAKLQSAFFGGALPLQFTLDIEVRNPNSSTAAMNKMAWILYLNDDELTSGLLNQRVEIPQGGVGTIPMAISLDLRQVLSGKALDSILNLALAIAGEGNKPTKVSMRMKPSRSE